MALYSKSKPLKIRYWRWWTTKVVLNPLLCAINTFVQGGWEVFKQMLLYAGTAVKPHCFLFIGLIVLLITTVILALFTVTQQLSASVRSVKSQQIWQAKQRKPGHCDRRTQTAEREGRLKSTAGVKGVSVVVVTGLFTWTTLEKTKS